MLEGPPSADLLDLHAPPWTYFVSWLSCADKARSLQ